MPRPVRPQRAARLRRHAPLGGVTCDLPLKARAPPGEADAQGCRERQRNSARGVHGWAARAHRTDGVGGSDGDWMSGGARAFRRQRWLQTCARRRHCAHARLRRFRAAIAVAATGATFVRRARRRHCERRHRECRHRERLRLESRGIRPIGLVDDTGHRLRRVRMPAVRHRRRPDECKRGEAERCEQQANAIHARSIAQSAARRIGSLDKFSQNLGGHRRRDRAA